MENLVLDHLRQKVGQEFCSKIQFAPVPRGQEGDLAMQFFFLAKTEKKAPPVIAGEVADALSDCAVVERTSVTGPYLNLFFSATEFFKNALASPLTGTVRTGKKIMVEFSSPNTNKPLHLGHMRNHALGLSVCNLLEAAGAEVIRTSIANDRGVHICKSMLAYQRWGNGATPESVSMKPDHFVGHWYVKFSTEVKKDPTLDAAAQEMLVAWENGNAEVRDLWKKMNDWAFSGYSTTYDRQGIKFDKLYHESELYVGGREIVEHGLDAGLLAKKDDGAIFIDLDDIGLDEKILLRGNGTTVYMTQDLHTTVKKQEDFNPDQQIWVVADEQNYHFRVLFHILGRLGAIDPEKLHHLGYGLVNLPDGRMKSREGTVVDADNLMDELHDLATTAIRERHEDWSDDEVADTAEKIQNAAWKFFLLQTSPKKTITFDAQKSIAFEGATGPYLQYAAVRIQSMLRKAGDLSEGDAAHLGDAEKPLGVKLMQFSAVIDRGAENLNPTYVLTYLLELAQDWSSYYAATPVVNADDADIQAARITLARKVLATLETGMKILGFEAPERM